MFDSLSCEDISSLAVIARLEMGMTVIFRGLCYAKGRLRLPKAADRITEPA